MNIVEGTMGLGGAGIVRGVGSQVSGLSIGDRVVIEGKYLYSTFAKAKATHCFRIPDELSFEDAATMASVYVTVIYSLFDLARLEAGQVSRHRNAELSVCTNVILTRSPPVEHLDSFSLWCHWVGGHPDQPNGGGRDICLGGQRRKGPAPHEHFWYSSKSDLLLPGLEFPPPSHEGNWWKRS